MVNKHSIDSFHRRLEEYYKLKDPPQNHVDNHNVITVSASVAPEFIHCLPDHKGRMHQHFYVIINSVLEGDKALVDNNTVFVAAHYGDEAGMPEPIPDIQPGNPIVIKGKFVPGREAYKSDDNPGYPVLHFTHHPVGYILHGGVKYE